MGHNVGTVKRVMPLTPVQPLGNKAAPAIAVLCNFSGSLEPSLTI